MRSIKQVIVVTWMGVTTLALGQLEWRHADASPEPKSPTSTTSATFDRITVHRIDIVEPDGKPRVIVSNKAREPGAVFGGKEYPHPDREQTGGILFYNDDGTEAGGLVYGSHKGSGSQSAGAMLSMDQFNQNETMKLEYQEEDGRRGAGLVVFGDRPNVSLEPVIAAAAELARAPDDATRAAVKARLDKLADESVGHESKRVFVGREQDDALIMLSDKQGVPRLVMQVDGKGEPSLQFFDAAGNPSKTIAAVGK